MLVVTAESAQALVFSVTCSCICNGQRLTFTAQSLIRSNMYANNNLSHVNPVSVTAANFGIALETATRTVNEACENLAGAPPGVGQQCFGGNDADLVFKPALQTGCLVNSGL